MTSLNQITSIKAAMTASENPLTSVQHGDLAFDHFDEIIVTTCPHYLPFGLIDDILSQLSMETQNHLLVSFHQMTTIQPIRFARVPQKSIMISEPESHSLSFHGIFGNVSVDTHQQPFTLSLQQDLAPSTVIDEVTLLKRIIFTNITSTEWFHHTQIIIDLLLNNLLPNLNTLILDIAQYQQVDDLYKTQLVSRYGHDVFSMNSFNRWLSTTLHTLPNLTHLKLSLQPSSSQPSTLQSIFHGHFTLPQLESLNLSQCGLTTGDISHLCHSTSFHSLKELNLSENPCFGNSTAVPLLLEWVDNTMPHLEKLNLWGYDSVGNGMVVHFLFSSIILKKLSFIDFSRPAINEFGLALFFNSPILQEHDSNITTISLKGRRSGNDQMLKLLANTKGLCNVRKINVIDCPITSQGLLYLGESQYLNKLECIDYSDSLVVSDEIRDLINQRFEKNLMRNKISSGELQSPLITQPLPLLNEMSFSSCRSE